MDTIASVYACHLAKRQRSLALAPDAPSLALGWRDLPRPRAGKRWDYEETGRAVVLLADGHDPDAVGAAIGRTAGGVRQRAERLVRKMKER